MIGFIIQNNNINIQNLVNGIFHYYNTDIPLISWTQQEHDNFEIALHNCKKKSYESTKQKYTYISNFVNSKSISECVRHFKYCKKCS